MADGDLRYIITEGIAAIHRRIDDKNRVDDQRHGEILDRFEAINGKVGRAHDRASKLEGRVDGLENREGLPRDGVIQQKDLRIWLLVISASIGGTLAFLRFIGKL